MRVDAQASGAMRVPACGQVKPSCPEVVILHLETGGHRRRRPQHEVAPAGKHEQMKYLNESRPEVV